MKNLINSLKPGFKSGENLVALKKLQEYDISFVLDKLIFDKKIAKEDAQLLETEFKKFIALTHFNIFPLAMISPQVDEVWHQFILFTRHYKDFCFETVGRFIGHMPDTSKTPIPLQAGENFRSGYKKYFGNIPEIWYKGMDPKTKEYYLQPILTDKPPKKWSGWTGGE